MIITFISDFMKFFIITKRKKFNLIIGCMSSFSTPQELENCFLRCERENMIGEESSNGNHVLQQSVQEIQSTLKEEQFYSSGYFLQLLYFDFTEFLQQDSFYFMISRKYFFIISFFRIEKRSRKIESCRAKIN